MRFPSKNICSVRHKPIPEAPKAIAKISKVLPADLEANEHNEPNAIIADLGTEIGVQGGITIITTVLSIIEKAANGHMKKYSQEVATVIGGPVPPGLFDKFWVVMTTFCKS